MWINRVTPCCGKEIEVNVQPYTGYTKCPHCDKPLEVEFDVVYVEEENEEYDYYDLFPCSIEDYNDGMDKFESKKSCRSNKET
jgi:hypothetical protein